MKPLLLLVVTFITSTSQAQYDSSLYYIESIEIIVEDSTTEIQKLRLIETDMTLHFDSPEKLRLIGINKMKEYVLEIITNRDTIEVKNLCEYLSPNSKYAFWITLPQNYSGTLFGIYTTTGGMVLTAKQEIWKQNRKSNTGDSHVYVQSGPISYEGFEMIHYLR